MKIEVLFPEICNLYGELMNIDFLQKASDDIEIIETNLTSEPLFASEVPDLIYMGTMSEKSQILVIEKLSQYKDRIRELIDAGANFLITGNALEVFGEKIHDIDGTVVEGMGLFPITTKRNMMNRFNSLYLGDFNGIDIVGFKSQFTHSYWNDNNSGELEKPMINTVRGPGLNPGISGEGIRENNFMATYVIGPLLVLNPPLAKYILEQCGMKDASLPYEEAAMDAYNTRVTEYSDEKTGFYY